ncbi:ATP-binding protein [Pseudodesulfovibrio sp.]|uniref:ATP-binding protein n=1 Tax=Pseudodesulfovibrio sp. TaxID=2035812 RepID=UPI002621BDBB|nr:ATP-binding protein [Pseudodesulfovibrio sp.]MDD3310790.1 ATP-binding protein [Pseudodesulfovibrio sp.]
MSLIEHVFTTWRSMGVVRKFAAALGSMLALILFVAAMGFVALSVLEQKAGDIVAHSMRMQRLALEVDSRLQLARQAERDFILRLGDLGVEAARSAYAAEFTERIGDARRNVVWLQEMERFSGVRQGRSASTARLAELHDGLDRYSTHFRVLADTVSLTGAGSPEVRRMTGEMDADYLHLSSQVHQLAISAADTAQSAHEAIGRYSRMVKHGLVGSVLLALLLAGSIIHVLNRTVARNVVRLSDAATELSLGNLEARVPVRSHDEFGQLGQSLNVMAERMTALVGELEGAAAVASDRLMEAIDSISEGFALYDHRGRLVLANRQMRDVADRASVSLREGMRIEQVLRLLAESGQFINAMGREEEWVTAHLSHFRTAGPPLEEPMGDGAWLTVNIYHTGRGEAVVIISDVTEHKRHDMDMASMASDLEDLVRQRTKVLVEKAMELRQANRRLMELDKLKSSFLSSVSHELRTPLTSLLGFSKLIKRDFSRTFMPLAGGAEQVRLGRRIEANLDIIGSEGKRLTRLINDVLDLSRIESGREKWRFMEVDPSEAVGSAMEAASGMFSARPEVKLVVRRFDRVPAVHFDPDRLQQVLINLLSNAAKFTEAGEVSLDLYLDEQGRVRICVQDTGCGIDDDNLEHVFDKFHQVPQGDTLTHKPSGTGLGLAISRQIVEHYGGSIWAESDGRRGTAMHVALPVAAPDGKRLVLVVDDDPAMREHLSMILKRAGYGVRTASGGREALDQAARRIPDLVTMDLLMPGMDGRETMLRFKGDPALTRIPIIVISALGDNADLGDAVLLKPIDGDAFVDAVRALLGDGGVCRPMLVLGGPAGARTGILACLEGDGVTLCSASDLQDLLDRGFAGTVLVPRSQAGEVDLTHICSLPGVQVLLLPDALAADSPAPSVRPS